VGEEGGGQGAPAEEASYFWFVDPIDGTTNFANGIPYYAISIALTDANRTPLVGVVYDATRDHMHTAIKGQGAKLNGETLHISNTRNLIDSVISSGFPASDVNHLEEHLHLWGTFMQRTRGFRRLGSASLELAYVASGRLEAFWERNLNPWDVMAGILLVEEAGGMVTDFENGKTPQQHDKADYVASNGHLHQAILDILNNHHLT
jgi:myo-inositol-1(or 4)-monophosphatase